MLYTMLRGASTGDDYFPPRESSAMANLDGLENVVTKRPLDLFFIDRIARARKDRGRSLRFLLTIRDPRSVLVSRHATYPHQFFMDAHRSFQFDPDWVAFVNPGLLDHADAINAALGQPGIKSRLLRYEHVLTKTEAIRRAIETFSGLTLDEGFASFHERVVPDGLLKPLNGLRPLDPARRRSWVEPQFAARLVRQFRLAPALFTHLEAWGYETDRRWYERLAALAPEGLDDTPGTIIAFHTPDAVYTGEAGRLRRSVDRLALPSRIVVMPGGDDWLATVRMKVAFLRDMRARLRGPLCYVDADAVVHSDPWRFLRGIDTDVAYAVLRDGKARSGTVFLADSAGARTFLDDWQARLDAAPQAWDQHPLDDIARRYRQGDEQRFTLTLLPPELCCIFDSERSAKNVMFRPTVPVIEQLQASREGRQGIEEALARRRARIAEIDRAHG